MSDKKEQEIINLFIDNVPFPMIIFNKEKVLYLNNEAHKLLKSKKTEEKNLFDILYYSNSSKFEIEKILNNENIVIKKIEALKLNNNEILEAEFSFSTVQYNNENAVLVSINEISETKKLNQRLLEQKLKLQSVINHIPHLIFFISKEGIITEYYNTHRMPLYKNPEEFLNKNIKEILPSHIVQEFFERIKLLNDENKIQQLIYELKINEEVKSYQAFIAEYNEDEIIVSINETSKDNYLFKTLFTDSYSIKLILDPETGKIINANKAACDFYGYTLDELLKMNINQINISDDLEIKNELRNAITCKKNFFQFKHKLKNGQIKDVEIYSNKIILDDKIRIYSIIHNKTEQIKLEQKYKQLFDNLIEAYALHEIITDDNNNPVDYRFLEVNDAFLELTNSKSKEEIEGKTVKELWPLTEKYWIDTYGKVAINGERTSFENYSQSFNKWYLVNAYSPQKGQFAVSFIDITNIKSTQERLKILDKTIATAPICIIITDKNGNIQYVNPFFTELTGYQYDEVIGKNPRILKSGYHDNNFYKQMWDTLLSGKTWRGALYNKKKDNSCFWETVRITPILNDEGKISNYVAIKIDITENILMRDELIKAKEKAEHNEKLKTAFLANMSHEIRTPLNSIIGFAELLLQNPNEVQSLEYLNIIKHSSERLFNLINDILEISRIDAGEVNILESEFNIHEEFENIYNQLILEAKSKNITIQLYPKSSENDFIISDRSKIISIISNLVKNAIKYTHHGYIEFGYKIENFNLIIIVKDTGIGINKDKQQIIFERFVQEDIRSSKPYEGVGLGLSIVKSYVELLKGTIELESEPDKGSFFKISIPVQERNTSKSEEKEKKNINISFLSEPILIIEDDISSGELLKIFLLKHTSTVYKAENATSALELLKHTPVKIIFSDIKLPDINGFELMKLIKEKYPEIIIVGQSGFALDDDIQNAIDEGFDFYITKPITSNVITNIMEAIYYKLNSL